MEADLGTNAGELKELNEGVEAELGYPGELKELNEGVEAVLGYPGELKELEAA